MSWLLSLLVALLTAALGLLVTGTVAGLSAEWHHMSSFEGASGYFVVAMALLGGIAGFLLGLVVARVVAARRRPGFLKATGAAFGIVLATGITVAGVSRLLADVPPEIDGQQLFLRVELRWPESDPPTAAMRSSAGVMTLGALSGSTLRAREEGPLFADQAALVDGRWMMPAAVKVFTSRGSRLVMFRLGETELPAFALPLQARPDAADRRWSEWLPHSNSPDSADPATGGGFSYRFRVQLADEPFRTDTVGPFEVETRLTGLYRVGLDDRFAAHSDFTVRHAGLTVPRMEHVSAAAVLGGSRPSLLVKVDGTRDGPAGCHLIHEQNGTVLAIPIGSCAAPIGGSPLTSDQETFVAARRAPPVPGWLDWTTFAEPGLFLVTQTVLDTRSLTFSAFVYTSGYSPNPSVPPLAVSPDRQSFVVLAYDLAQTAPALLVINYVTDTSYPLSIDRPRMRFNNEQALGPAWVDHHFVWQPRGEGQRLSQRPSFVPLPYHGELTVAKAGEYQSYVLQPGGVELREAVTQMLVDTLGGERLPDELGGYQRRVRLDGRELHLTIAETPGYVSVSMEPPNGDPAFMTGLAAKIDAWLADGEHDSLFVADRPGS